MDMNGIHMDSNSENVFLALRSFLKSCWHFKSGSDYVCTMILENSPFKTNLVMLIPASISFGMFPVLLIRILQLDLLNQ